MCVCVCVWCRCSVPAGRALFGKHAFRAFSRKVTDSSLTPVRFSLGSVRNPLLRQLGCLGRCRGAVGRGRAAGEQHRPDFSRSRSRDDGVRCLRRRRRCRVALIITGGRFRPRCYISTVFIVCGWAITSPRHRDTGVERAFCSASGMGARHREDPHRAGGCGVAPSCYVVQSVLCVAA